jgi:hypothetical protein
LSAHLKRPWLLLAMVAAFAFAGVGIAAAVTTERGGKIRGAMVTSDTNIQHASSTNWQNVNGAAQTITVPKKKNWLVIARFTAESVCRQPAAEQSCYVRILAGATPMNPASDDFRFDTQTPPVGEQHWQGHAVDRSITLSPGTYTVQVQGKVDAAGGDFKLDDWHLTVEWAETKH